MKKKISIKRIAFIAIFSSLASILYLFGKFNLPIFPSFLDINLSMIPIIIATFMLGPVDGGIVVLVRFVIKIITVGTSTSYVGELADILISLPTVLVAGSLYHYTKFKHKELLSFLSVVVLWTLLGILSNYLISVPFYISYYFGGNIDPLIGMCQIPISLITFNNVVLDSSNFMGNYLLFAALPFNLILSISVVLITLLVHKRIKMLYDIIN